MMWYEDTPFEWVENFEEAIFDCVNTVGFQRLKRNVNGRIKTVCLLYTMSTSSLDLSLSVLFYFFCLLSLLGNAFFFRYWRCCYAKHKRSTQTSTSNEWRTKKNYVFCCHGWQSTKQFIKKELFCTKIRYF